MTEPQTRAQAVEDAVTSRMRGLRVRRAVAGTFTVAWVVVAVQYWRNHVPLVPTAVVALPRTSIEVRFLPSGEYTICSLSEGEISDALRLGPVQFWNATRGEKTREVLGPQDQIVGISPFVNLAVVRRNGTTQCVDLQDGSILFDHEAHSQDVRVVFSLDESLVAYIQPGNSTSVFHSRSGRLEWSSPRTDFMWDKVARVDGLTSWRMVRWGNDSHVDETLAEAFIGGRIPRQFPKRMTISRDGKWAMDSAVDDGTVDVHAFQSAERLWSLRMPSWQDRCRFGFSEDGHEIHCAVASGTQFHVARWEAASGRSIAPVPDGPLNPTPPLQSETYICGIGQRTNQFLPDSVRQFLQKCGLSLPVTASTVTNFVDRRTGRWAGFVPMAFPVHAFPGRTGIALMNNQHLSLYVEPFRRNWTWLFLWSIGPPALLLCACMIWRNRFRANTAVRTSCGLLDKAYLSEQN
jgi:hypothetical protein